MSTKKQPFEIKSERIIFGGGMSSTSVEISIVIDVETGANYLLVLTRCLRQSASDTTQFIPRLDASGNIMVTKKEDSVGS